MVRSLAHLTGARIPMQAVAVAAAVAFGGCGAHHSSDTATDKASGNVKLPLRESDNWAVSDKLPLLRETLILPKRNVGDFAVDANYVRYPREPRPLRAKDAPVEEDVDAVAAAKAWITDNFGKMPDSTSLEVTRIEHSSSGAPKPAYDWDRGHTIVFKVTYHRIPTDGFAVVYIAGRSQFAASVAIHAYSPIPGSDKRIVDKATAVRRWRDQYEQQGADAAALAQFDQNVKPRLWYVWSPKAKENLRGESTSFIVAPTWVLEQEKKIMVDAQSGEPWFND